MMLLHPREATLLRYAAGSAQEAARRRVASHLADCDRCRGTVQSTRGIRAALARGAAAGAPDLLLQRILQSRLQGERVILPVEAPVARVRFRAPPVTREFRLPRPAFLVVLGSAAAVALFSVGIDNWSNRVVEQSEGGAPRAQPRRVAPRELKLDPRVPAAGPFEPARLRPVNLRYGVVTYGKHEVSAEAGPQIQLVRDPERKGNWIAISADPRFDRSPDSVWINGETLEATQWRSSGMYDQLTYRIEKNLFSIASGWNSKAMSLTLARRDSMSKRWKGRPQDTSFALPEGRAPVVLVRGGQMVAVMMATPLSASWKGTFSSASLAGNGFSINPIQTVTISGSEDIITPAGVFTCWEATVRRSGYEHIEWYRKSDGLYIGSSYENGSYRTLLLSEE